MIDWDQRFRQGDTPWEESDPPSFLQRLLEAYARPGQKLLEVGCGLGTNARWLAALGYQVHAIDLSKTAIEHAIKHHQTIPGLTFECRDFLDTTRNLSH